MKKIQVKDVKPYTEPKHFNATARRLQGKEESGAQKFWMGLSHFLPGGGAEYDESPAERVYFVLEGQMTVVSAANERIVLKAWDSIRIGPGEGHSMINAGNLPASMLAVTAYPET
jgi:mannose-6-phosphate isomerase-like protein (cupin superfamily)